jgi:L-threonate 2-dehydrogenase
MTDNPVGVVGLGDMGGAIARSLLDRGHRVVGFDPDPVAAGAFEDAGGVAVVDVASVGEAARVVITCLPSVESLEATLDETTGLLSRSGGQPTIVVEMSTFDLDTKRWAYDAGAAQGATMLDCPISGTAHQAPSRDLAIFASGDEAAIERVREVLGSFAREVIAVGPYGDGSKAKYLANLMVGIHNAAAAEALTLATKSGMDPDRVFRALRAGAADSRMLEVRGPFMLEGDYREGSSGGRTYAKDRGIIAAFAHEEDCPVPLFEVASRLHDDAIAHGFDNHDSAAVCAASLRLAGLEPAPLKELAERVRAARSAAGPLGG